MNNELYEKLTRLQWLIHKQHLSDHRRGSRFADPTRGQGRILAALQMKDGISTKDLSYLLGLAVSSLNEFLAKLEKNGYVTREPSEQDKRVMLVKLTDEGRAQQSQLHDVADLEDIFSCLSEEEQQSLGALLDKLIAALGEKLGFEEDELEWLKTNNARRDRIFAKMMDADERGFGPHGPGGFGPHGPFGPGDFGPMGPHGPGGFGAKGPHGHDASDFAPDPRGGFAPDGFDPRDPRGGFDPRRGFGRRGQDWDDPDAQGWS